MKTLEEGINNDKRQNKCLKTNDCLINDFSLSFFFFLSSITSLVAQMVKSLPAKQETQVQSLGEENPLEKEMASHSGILA